MGNSVDTVWVVIAAKGSVVADDPPHVWDAQHKPSGYLPLKPKAAFQGGELVVVAGNEADGPNDWIRDAAALLGTAAKVAFKGGGGDNPWPPPPPPPPDTEHAQIGRNPWPPPPPPPPKPETFADTLLQWFLKMPAKS